MKRTIDKFKSFLTKKKPESKEEPKLDHRKEFERMIDKYGDTKHVGTSWNHFE